MLKPGELYWSVVEPHWERISIYNGEEVFLREFNSTERRARNLFAAHWCVSEVRNGGFDQFFVNSTGILAPEAEEAFDAIGLHQLAQLVRRATSVFGTPYPRDRDERQDTLSSLADVQDPDDEDAETVFFEELNYEFFKLIRTEAGGWDTAADRYAMNEA